jgi:hypothetical protein
MSQNIVSRNVFFIVLWCYFHQRAMSTLMIIPYSFYIFYQFYLYIFYQLKSNSHVCDPHNSVFILACMRVASRTRPWGSWWLEWHASCNLTAKSNIMVSVHQALSTILVCHMTMQWLTHLVCTHDFFKNKKITWSFSQYNKMIDKQRDPWKNSRVSDCSESIQNIMHFFATYVFLQSL